MARFNMKAAKLGESGKNIVPGVKVFALYGPKDYCIAKVTSVEGDQVRFEVETIIDPDMNMYPGGNRPAGSILSYCQTLS